MSSLNLLFFVLIFTALPHPFVSKLEGIDVLLDRLDSKRVNSSVQESAAKAVLQRLLPTHVNSFQFKIVSKVFLYLKCFGVSSFKN